MVQEIMPHLYKLDIPLPNNPLKSLNSYVIKGKERNLIIDTGMNRDACKEAMGSSLAELDVDLEVTDFFITHMHADHSGLLSSLTTAASKVYCSAADAAMINDDGAYWEQVHIFVETGGFPEAELETAVKKHPGYKYRSLGTINFTIAKENDIIRIGDYRFQCVETPGHTQGHLCLYDAAKKILVSGDHILNDITPNISLLSYRLNPLDNYLNSLQKVYDYDVEMVLPGHRRLFSDHRKRIDELRVHHNARAEEVLAILEEKGQKTAYQVAAFMTWDITYRSFDEFPVAQKWFASGEALAHLKYLEEKGLVQKELQGKSFVFSIK